MIPVFVNFRAYIRSQIPGFAAGAGLVLAIAITLFAISRPATPTMPERVYVVPGTGAPARVDEPRRDGDMIQYPLSYDDAGTSTLNVPIDSIPEARAWRHEVWSTSFLYLSEGTIGILKGYRWECLDFSAGPWVRNERVAIPKLHYRSRDAPDFGVAFMITKYSESPLY